MINNSKLLESFRSECTVIDFLKQDEHWVGNEKFAIVTDLSQAELQNKYGLLLGEYTPFVILTTYQAEEIEIFNREVHRQEMAVFRHEDGFGYSDEISEYFHAELAVPSAEDIVIARENEETARDQLKADIQRLHQALKMLNPIQRERLIKNVCMGHSITDLAEAEGVSYTAVRKCLNTARKNLKKFFENL